METLGKLFPLSEKVLGLVLLYNPDKIPVVLPRAPGADVRLSLRKIWEEKGMEMRGPGLLLPAAQRVLHWEAMVM